MNKRFIIKHGVVLLGPTGAGKSPLGDLLEQRSSGGRRIHHFDFGVWLRAAALEGAESLSAAEVKVIRRCLAEGALLEKSDFGIARAILEHFIEQHGVGTEDVVLFNGWPRDCAQASALDAFAKTVMVINLLCDAQTVRERLRLNSGGDRHGRNDDTPAQIEARLKVYRNRTYPLLDYYREKEILVCNVNVEVNTTAEEAAAQLAVF